MAQLTQVKVSRRRAADDPIETKEAGRVATVLYGDTQILTVHGLKLMEHDLGMEAVLDLLSTNADKQGWPLVLETPPELYEETDCAGLIFRPSYWQYDLCIWWVEREGRNLIQHFGVGARFSWSPKLFEMDAMALRSNCPGSGLKPVMKVSKDTWYGRGRCRHSGKDFALMENGRLRNHGYTSIGGGRPSNAEVERIRVIGDWLEEETGEEWGVTRIRREYLLPLAEKVSEGLEALEAKNAVCDALGIDPARRSALTRNLEDAMESSDRKVGA